MKRYNIERGSNLLKFIDKYVGIPLIFLLGLFKKKRKKPNKIERIALLKTAAIGDTTILTAIIKDIKDYDPKIKITLFSGGSNYEFAKLLTKQFSNLEIIKLPIKNSIKAIKLINKQKFDVFLDFGPWPRLNAIFSFFSNSKYTVGFKTKNQYRHFIYDNIVVHSDKVHELENYKNIIRTIGIKKNNLPHINFIKNNNNINNVIVIHMFPGGSKSYLKEWPEEYWVNLINYLTKTNNLIYLTGAKIDRNRALKIKNLCKEKNKIIVSAGEFSLEKTIELINNSKLLISVNTGIMHIASALKCNLIVLNGPTSSKRWGPLNENAISLQSSLECSPCLNLGFEYGCNEDKCMKHIKIKDVINAIKQLGIE